MYLKISLLKTWQRSSAVTLAKVMHYYYHIEDLSVSHVLPDSEAAMIQQAFLWVPQQTA